MHSRFNHGEEFTGYSVSSVCVWGGGGRGAGGGGVSYLHADWFSFLLFVCCSFLLCGCFYFSHVRKFVNLPL